MTRRPFVTPNSVPMPPLDDEELIEVIDTFGSLWW